MNSANIIQKLWSDCGVLRDDGMLYVNFVERFNEGFTAKER